MAWRCWHSRGAARARGACRSPASRSRSAAPSASPRWGCSPAGSTTPPSSSSSSTPRRAPPSCSTPARCSPRTAAAGTGRRARRCCGSRRTGRRAGSWATTRPPRRPGAPPDADWADHARLEAEAEALRAQEEADAEEERERAALLGAADDEAAVDDAHGAAREPAGLGGAGSSGMMLHHTVRARPARVSVADCGNRKRQEKKTKESAQPRAGAALDLRSQQHAMRS